MTGSYPTAILTSCFLVFPRGEFFADISVFSGYSTIFLMSVNSLFSTSFAAKTHIEPVSIEFLLISNVVYFNMHWKLSDSCIISHISPVNGV